MLVAKSETFAETTAAPSSQRFLSLAMSCCGHWMRPDFKVGHYRGIDKVVFQSTLLGRAEFERLCGSCLMASSMLCLFRKVTIRNRVITARNVQLRRFYDDHVYTNAQMGPRHIRKYCVLTPDCEKIMENAVTKLGFSARGYDRILRVARTIADIEGVDGLEPRHLAEAVQYRTLDRNLWV
jgi:Magnesium chelatase, subunit ChlI C-terminal